MSLESLFGGMRRRAFLRAGATVSVTTGCPSVTAHPEPDAGNDTNNTTSGEYDETPYRPLGTVEVPGAREAVVDSGVAYVATKTGFTAVDVADPGSPAVLSERREIETTSGQSLGGIWEVQVQRNRLVAAGPAHRADGPSGFALFDVSDPSRPVQEAFYETDFHIHNAAIDGDTVGLTGSGLPDTPLVLVDVSTDTDPTEVGRWSPVEHDQRWEAVSPGLRPLHDVTLRDGVAYLLYWDAGTWALDVSDPGEPVVRSRIGGRSPETLRGLSTGESGLQRRIPPGNHHYGAVSDDGSLLAVGAEAWATTDTTGAVGETGEVVGGPGGIDLWDVRDLTAPDHRARIAPPPSDDQTTSGEFTTAHNCDIDGDRLYASWYYGGVSVHDVSDPADPVELARWRDSTEAAFWTAQATDDAFVASSASLTDFDPRLDETREALYTFPDRPGTQVGETPADGAGTETTDETASASGHGFGLAGALAALGGGYLLARRQSEQTQ